MPLPPSENRIISLYRNAQGSIFKLEPTPTSYTSAFPLTSHYLVTTAHSLPPPPLTLSSPHPLHLIHHNPAVDIAILHSPTPLPSPPFHPSPLSTHSLSPIFPGMNAYAIFSTADETPAIAAGIVSSLGRSARGARGATLHGLIQIDVPVNRGASGGVLLASDGRLLGMICAIASWSGAFEGVAFAIPVQTLLEEWNRWEEGRSKL